MPPRTLKVPKTVRDLVRHLHPHLKQKVRAGLNDILEGPNCGKPLERELKGYWSLRISRYRIVYRPDEAGAEIVAIGPRNTIYEEMARYLLQDRHQN
ncbi:MAG: type II toxin-antitoxin system RelE/ParE family toxin [Acidobacteria bacterium]|nr:type II toxin-antitoxin system RelE/ParE family toxin [Acidobacteriota bacterium]